MKWLTAGVTVVNVWTVSALLIGMAADGLTHVVAKVALVIALLAGAVALMQTRDADRVTVAPEGDAATKAARNPFARVWFWILAACFGFFAFRSFGWVLFLDGNTWKVQSPNNLGDLSLHIAYIKNFALGVPLWPENPIHPFSYMRYPGGTDLFNALLLELGVDFVRGLVWAGVLGSIATFYALYRWSGEFGVAGFLFNGGVAGFQLLSTWTFKDYQGVPEIAWKSLPLSMLVTQRGLLYALPAGLLLLCHWRRKYFAQRAGGGGKRDAQSSPGILPFWVELTLYATMPLFHMHTFIALSLLAAFFFVIGDAETRKRLAIVVGAAVLPATFFVYMITDHFRARSMIEWQPGWVQNEGEFAAPFLTFWLVNFGVWLPLAMFLIVLVWWRVSQSLGTSRARTDEKIIAPNEDRHLFQPDALKRFVLAIPTMLRNSPALAFLTPAALIFLFAALVKTAPWEWDNIKLFIWAYLLALPFLWSELLARLPLPVRVGTCIALFGSGLVSLFGGLLSNPGGFGLADRAELDAVGDAVRKLPAEARFASHPTYNHPLLLQGRKVVLGYPGHLWTQGFDYADINRKLDALMRGAPDWREHARAVGAPYLFWGREEQANYAGGTRAWEREARLVASGPWGAIYDLEHRPGMPVER
jgi:hypothetical protein